MSVPGSSMLSRWFSGFVVGACLLMPLLPPALSQGFGVYTDPNTGQTKYYRPLICTYRRPNVLFPFILYEALNAQYLSYTPRSDLDCCYRATSRNQCCIYNDGGFTKCKCSASTSCGAAPPTCQAPFVKYQTSTCVGLIRNLGTAHDARVKCRNADPAKKGDLAQVKTLDFNNFIKTNLLGGVNTNVWMGLRKLSNNQFGWLDFAGTETPLGVYNDWNDNKPDTEPEKDCVILDTVASWKWNNVKCGGTNNFALCQYSL